MNHSLTEKRRNLAVRHVKFEQKVPNDQKVHVRPAQRPTELSQADRHYLRSINGVEERSFQWPTEYRCEYLFRTTGKPNL